MAKKYLTIADKTLDDINRVKEIINAYEDHEKATSNSKDKEDIIYRKTYMENQLKELQERYKKFSKTNEPYYDPDSYEFYKNVFSKVRVYDLDSSFIYYITDLADKEMKSSLKVKILRNICKAYKETKEIQ